MYTKLGEEFLVLLPEIIPFLSELMEGRGGEGGEVTGPMRACIVTGALLLFATDESVEVEQQTQVVISVIEGIMGESIQQFF